MNATTDATEEIYLILDKIEQYGFAVLGIVSDDQGSPAFAYTIGLSKVGLPELFAIGNLQPETLQFIVTTVAGAWLHSGTASLATSTSYFEGRTGQPMPVGFLELDPAYIQKEYLVQVERVLGKAAERVVQVLWADDQGNLPGSKPYRGSIYVQPLFPPRTAPL